MRESSQRIALVGVAVFIGCVVGSFLGNDSAEIKRLQTEITNLKSEHARLPGLASARLRTRSASNSNIPAPATNSTNSGVPQPLSQEWQAQMQAEFHERSLYEWGV